MTNAVAPWKGVQFLAALLAEKNSEDAERIRAAGLLPGTSERLIVLRLTPVVHAMVLEEAERVLGPGQVRRVGAGVGRVGVGVGVESVLKRLREEDPPELPLSSMTHLAGGETPQGRTVKTLVDEWVRANLDALAPAATAAWGPRWASNGRRRSANDSMIVQYAFERLRRAEGQ